MGTADMLESLARDLGEACGFELALVDGSIIVEGEYVAATARSPARSSISRPVAGMKPRLTVVTLGVSDLARARRFYCEGLGWRASSTSSEHIVFVDVGGVVLALYPREQLAEDAKLSPTGSTPTGA